MDETIKLNIVIVGIGGVGSALAPKLGRYCQYLEDHETQIMLIDGDSYETQNAQRQDFDSLGNKAEVTAEMLGAKFDRVTYLPMAEYLTEENIDFYLDSGSIVFICVDNHKTRKLIDSYMESVDTMTLISGGNDLTDGNVQLVLRRNGQFDTATLSEIHPEIDDPQDKSPHEMSCEEQAAESEPQLFFANDMVSTFMCTFFFNLMENHEFVAGEPPFAEIYFDFLLGAVRFARRPSSKTQPPTNS